VAGKKLYIHNDSKIVRFKDYNKDGVIGHNKDTPYKGVTKGQVLSFREPHDALYTAFFTKEGDFRGYFKKDYSGEETEWHHPEKWDNFDWQTNNNRMKTAMYKDGWHHADKQTAFPGKDKSNAHTLPTLPKGQKPYYTTIKYEGSESVMKAVKWAKRVQHRYRSNPYKF
jgi:hypothetical protein